MVQKFIAVKSIAGELNLPGDKSISHRALMFASLANGESKIYNLSDSEDVASTKKCLEQLGIEFEIISGGIKILARGYRGLRKSFFPLDAGNSGTTARLLSGILSGQNFSSTIIGDQSLSNRPMKRIIEPLTSMGVGFKGSASNTLPLVITPPDKLTSIHYTLPIPSAQVKSVVLLAGLHCEDTTEVIETYQSRNHTELMLGLQVSKSDDKSIIKVSKKNYPEPNNYFVPSDISSAAYFIVLALLTRNSSLVIRNVSLNETRTGFFALLKKMGGTIDIYNEENNCGEKYGDVIVKSSNLKNVIIEKEIIPNIIDEIPILSVAGIFTEGAFEIRNASELRNKESDRIKSLCENYKMLGLNVEEYQDGFMVEGKIKNDNAIFESNGDHRIAMAFSVLSLLLKNGAAVKNFNCVKISNPHFLKQINSISDF